MPEAIENCRILIIQTIMPSGEMAYSVKRDGDVPLSTYVGLIEMAKVALISSVAQQDIEDEDDE